MTRIDSIIAIALLGALLGGGRLFAAQQGRADVALRAAIEIETVKGDPKAAIEAYKEIAKGSDKAIAAQALWRMAGCYVLLGDAEARKVYEQIVRDFGNQPEAVQARDRLASLSKADTTVAPRLVRRVEPSRGSDHQMSADDRTMVLWDLDTMDIYTHDLGAGRVTRLNAQIGPPQLAPGQFPRAQWPAISPDSKQVAYSFLSPGAPAQLRLMPNQPGAPHRVLVEGNGHHVPVGWSPDGTRILTMIQGPSKGEPGRRWTLAWVAASDSRVTEIQDLGMRAGNWTFSNTSRPSLSPDGRFLAYAGFAPDAGMNWRDEDTHVYVVAANGSSPIQVTRTAGTNEDPVWTNDGRRLLFLSDRQGDKSLWSVEMENGKPIRDPVMLWRAMNDTELIGVTKAGVLYFQAQTPPTYTIAIASTTQGAVAPRIVTGREPAWSADGRALALLRPMEGTEIPRMTLLVHDVATGDERKFDRTPPLAWVRPIWFHDRQRILVANRLDTGVASVSSLLEWHVVDLRTGAVSRVLPVDPRRGLVLGLSADDTKLFFISEAAGEGIVAHDLVTGARTTIMRLPPGLGTLTAVALSPDGRLCAVVSLARSNDVRLGVIDMAVGTYRELTKQLATTAWSLGWSGDASTIYWGLRPFVVEQPMIEPRTLKIPVTGGAQEFVSLDGRPVVSPDGSRIAEEQTTGPDRTIWSVDVGPLLRRVTGGK